MDVGSFCKLELEPRMRVGKGAAAKFSVSFPKDRLAAFEEALALSVTREGGGIVATGGCELRPGVYQLEFTPDETGFYVVSVGLGMAKRRVEVELVSPGQAVADTSSLVMGSEGPFRTLQPLSFRVTFPTSHPAKKTVTVVDPRGNEVELKREVHVGGSIRGPNPAPMAMTCHFTPALPGEYRIDALVDGQFHARGSPLALAVEDALGEAIVAVRAVLGPGPHMTAKPLVFRVHFPEALADALSINVLDPAGRAVPSCDGNELGPGLWECTTSPLGEAGTYRVEVAAGAHKVSEAVDVVPCETVYCLQCRAEGAGLEDGRIAAWAKAPFRFYYPPDMSEDIIRIQAVDDEGTPVEMDGEASPGEQGCWICFYSPVRPGAHTISISCGDCAVPGFPRRVTIAAPEKVFLNQVVVEGLRDDVTTFDERCVFSVAYPDSVPAEAVTVEFEGPSGAVAPCDRGADPHECSFPCGVAGDYAVYVKLNGVEVAGSPFLRTVVDPAVAFAAQCSVSGDGILSGMNSCGYATDFVLTFQCPEEYLSIGCIGPDGKATLIDGMELEGRPNCWRVEYLPAAEGEYVISICVGQIHIPNSPFRVVVRPSIGGRGKLLVFFSSASGKKAAQRDLNRLEQLFLAKGLLDDKFEPFHAVDTWEREAREELFRIAGSRSLPQVWINDYPVGDVNKLQELEDEHVLSMLLEKMFEDAKKPDSPLEQYMLVHKAGEGVKLGAAKAAVEGEKCVLQ